MGLVTAMTGSLLIPGGPESEWMTCGAALVRPVQFIRSMRETFHAGEQLAVCPLKRG
jgi:hypothetical protein